MATLEVKSESPDPVIKKPKIEPEDDQAQLSQSEVGDLADVKTEDAIVKEEIEIKEEIIEVESPCTTSNAGVQTDRDDKLEIKEEINRLVTLVQPPKKVVKGKKLAVTEDHILQFYVTLLRGKGAPKIWRRFQVPANYTFHQLHVAIQKAMGWESANFDYHLHAFRVVNPTTGSKDSIVISEDVGLYGGSKDENLTKIIDYFAIKNHKGKYEYDFGVGWQHEIVFEGAVEPEEGTKYPRCVEGAKACPPEDGVMDSDEEYDSDTFDPKACF